MLSFFSVALAFGTRPQCIDVKSAYRHVDCCGSDDSFVPFPVDRPGTTPVPVGKVLHCTETFNGPTTQYLGIPGAHRKLRLTSDTYAAQYCDAVPTLANGCVPSFDVASEDLVVSSYGPLSDDGGATWYVYASRSDHAWFGGFPLKSLEATVSLTKIHAQTGRFDLDPNATAEVGGVWSAAIPMPADVRAKYEDGIPTFLWTEALTYTLRNATAYNAWTASDAAKDPSKCPIRTLCSPASAQGRMNAMVGTFYCTLEDS